MSKMVWTFPGGRLIDNFATLGAVATISFTVPAGKKWLVYGGTAERDANATFDVGFYNSADKPLQIASQVVAGTTIVSWGALCLSLQLGAGIGPAFPFVLKAGDYVKYTWGAAQTTPEVLCIVEEIDA